MSDDQFFRWILLTGIVLLGPIAFYHRLRAHTGEPIDRGQEGWFILLTLRPVALVGMIGLVAYLVNPQWMAWSALPLSTWVRWAGVGLGLAAAALLFWTFRNLGKNLTDTVVTRKEHTLVTTGPYRWVRHPFYVAFLLAVVANCLAAANWFVLAAGVTVFALMAIRSRREEANLLARFGDEYRQYRDRTGRFWPKFGNG